MNLLFAAVVVGVFFFLLSNPVERENFRPGTESLSVLYEYDFNDSKIIVFVFLMCRNKPNTIKINVSEVIKENHRSVA